MDKYSDLKIFKETKARASHVCSDCGNQIKTGDIYFAETFKDRFLHSLHNKKLCEKCYAKINK